MGAAVAFVVASHGMVLAGCSASNEDNGGVALLEDGSLPEDASTHDAFAADVVSSDSTVGDASAPDAALGLHAHLVVVNGSPNAPALRFCFGAGDPAAGGTELAAVPAEPDDDIASAANGLPYPGVFTGAGAPALDPGTDWSQTAVALFAIDAQRIRSQVRSQDAAQANCRALLGTDGGGALLTADRDYWYLGAVPKGTLADGTAWLTAVFGCLPGIADGAAPCAATDAAASAMGGVWELDNATAVDPGALGAQFVNASFALSSGTAIVTAAGVYLGADSSSTRVPIASDVSGGTLRPPALAQVNGVAFDKGGFFVEATSPDGGVVGLASPFSTIVQSTWGAKVPEGGALVDGAGYVFVLVGDPALPDDGTATGTPAGRLLAFPTNPPFGSP